MVIIRIHFPANENWEVIPSDKPTVPKAEKTSKIILVRSKFPSVMVVDSAGSVVVGAVNYVDVNNLTVSFAYQFTGSVDLN